MASEAEQPDPRPPRLYPPTLWTQILLAQGNGPQSEEAWRILVERYRPLILAVIRGHIKDDPDNLADKFVATDFLRKLIPGADKSKGIKFRTCLAVTLRGFIIDELRSRYAEKRGGGETPASLDGETVPECADPSIEPESFGRTIDEALARSAFSRALESVRTQYVRKGETIEHFELLIGREAGTPVAEVARKLNKSPGAVKVERSRLKQRFLGIFRREVADLVPPTDVDEEMRYLLGLLG